VTRRLAAKVVKSGTTLTGLQRVSFVVAAKILGEVGEVGDVTRIRSEASFAMLNGTAPLQASSGSTNRHRLNRGGNRQLNFALHVMANSLTRWNPESKAYIARRQRKGKTNKEAMRCLKRHLSNVVYRRLVADLTVGVIAPAKHTFRPLEVG
jgi:transposase